MYARTVALVNAVLMLHANPPLRLIDLMRATGLRQHVVTSALATLLRDDAITQATLIGHQVYAPNTRASRYEVTYRLALLDLPYADLTGSERVYAIYAYGSLAEPGRASAGSDLDLAVIGRVADRRAMVELANRCGQRWFGRDLDLLFLTPDEARQGAGTHINAALRGICVFGSNEYSR